jgi:hypothetical protein
MARVSIARTIRCARCHATWEIPEVTPELHCPFCGHRQPAATLHGELRDYQQAVEGKLEAAQQDAKYAAAWEQWKTYAAGKHVAIALGFILGVPLVLAIVANLLLRSGAGGPGVHVFMIGGSYAGVIGYLLWYFAGARRRQPAAAQVASGETAVACPQCGAPGALTPGQAVDACRYCRAALIPSQTVMIRSLDAVRQVARQARLERYRGERAGTARMMGYSKFQHWYLLYFAAMPVLFLAACVAMTARAITGAEPFRNELLGMWAIALALNGAGAYWFLYRRNKRREWRQALADLARQFRGRPLFQLTEWVDWLNAYWAGEYATIGIFQGTYGCAAAVDVYGFPGLIVADGRGMDDQHRKRRVELFLAAWVPGLSDGAERPPVPAGDGPAAYAWLASQGFTVEISEAGLRATALDVRVAQLHRAPASAHELAPILSALATVAMSIGAIPVGPA